MIKQKKEYFFFVFLLQKLLKWEKKKKMLRPIAQFQVYVFFLKIPESFIFKMKLERI